MIKIRNAKLSRKWNNYKKKVNITSKNLKSDIKAPLGGNQPTKFEAEVTKAEVSTELELVGCETGVSSVEGAVEAEPTNKKKFRIYARQLFLTYPKYGKNYFDVKPDYKEACKELLLTFSEKIGKKGTRIVDYIICIEPHEDGSSYHVHVYLNLERKISIRDPHELDLLVGQIVRHGNYQPVKSRAGVIDYLTKQECYITNIPIHQGRELQFQDVLIQKLKQEGLDPALDYLINSAPAKVLANDYIKISANLRALNATIRPVIARPNFDFSNFGFPSPVIMWYMLWPDEHKPALVLTGPSGTGKTEGLLALFTAKRDPRTILRVTERNTLKELTSETRLILLDDINFRGFTREEAIHLFESRQAGSLRVLHRTVELPAHVDRAWVSNYFPPYSYLPLEVKRRIFRVHWPLSWYDLEEYQPVGELSLPVFIWSGGQLYAASFILYQHRWEELPANSRYYCVVYLELVPSDKEGQLREYISQKGIYSVAGFKSEILRGGGFVRSWISTEAETSGEWFSTYAPSLSKYRLDDMDKIIILSLYEPFKDIIKENWQAVSAGVTSTAYNTESSVINQLPPEARTFDPDTIFSDKTKF